MARNGLLISAVLLVAVLAALVVVTVAERNVAKGRCMTECYVECMQINIFTEGECKRECIVSCARHVLRTTSYEDDHDAKFFPYWL